MNAGLASSGGGAIVRAADLDDLCAENCLSSGSRC